MASGNGYYMQISTDMKGHLSPGETDMQLKQFRQESDAWKRTLEFMRQENAFLKTRLAEILHNGTVSTDLLEMAEQYQSRFIQKDEIMHLMRKDVARQDDFFETTSLQNLKSLLHKQKTLRNEFKILENSFNRMKHQFNDYLFRCL